MESDFAIYHGDCLEIMKGIPDDSVDSIVTDPPYGLRFMGKKWDHSVPGVDIWSECIRLLKPGGHLLCFAGTRTHHRMACNIEDAGFEIRDMMAWLYGSGFPKSHNLNGNHEGWGTALKPALEPITMARRPFRGTVAQNVIQYGTGAINVNDCRVGDGEPRATVTGGMGRKANPIYGQFENTDTEAFVTTQGRWPANVIHDGLQEEWARYFYCPKASKKDRGNGNQHPTVKPTDLMAYLCRLVTPKAGTVLDPFMGSGSTGKAAIREGLRFIGIELDSDYVAIAEKRIKTEKDTKRHKESA